jgi:hypothetical protein
MVANHALQRSRAERPVHRPRHTTGFLAYRLQISHETRLTPFSVGHNPASNALPYIALQAAAGRFILLQSHLCI